MLKVLGKRTVLQPKILSPSSTQINEDSTFQKNRLLAFAVDGATKGKHL
jgi:hypothetical protein